MNDIMITGPHAIKKKRQHLIDCMESINTTADDIRYEMENEFTVPSHPYSATISEWLERLDELQTNLYYVTKTLEDMRDLP